MLNTAIILALACVVWDVVRSLSDAAAIHVYLKNQSDFAAMNEVYRTFFPADPPARTTIVADLVVPSGLVEMSAVGIPTGAERVVVHPPDWKPSEP